MKIKKNIVLKIGTTSIIKNELLNTEFIESLAKSVKFLKEEENIIKQEMSDEDFQFYKLQLKNNVKLYLDLDDQIKALNKAVSERRKEKKKL